MTMPINTFFSNNESISQGSGNTIPANQEFIAAADFYWENGEDSNSTELTPDQLYRSRKIRSRSLVRIGRLLGYQG